MTNFTHLNDIFLALMFQTYPDSHHAILTCRGGIFPIKIVWKPSSRESLSAVPLNDIYAQLVHAMSYPEAPPEQDPSGICGLSSLHRQTWHSVRMDILKTGGEAAVSLEMMESAILAVSLEDHPAPADLAEILNAVRLREKDSRCLRYYDKVCKNKLGCLYN